ncbi:FtsK/SpoIIIE domain-containing protein [Paenibacillus sp. Soil750]|uniref:FtsK/SpoIIIE domain-containing protein n=1 Tax=Paenibacillus sp. Soil750 TaxID=1736398 RepID=UPI0006FA6FBA|nr:FtsK/SpoIIIE domain-containing protein [Paenibacillus sp. Soil750]KRE70778.1 cell division protein FtsK [Paenibacillus sp. Soil750]
MLLEFIGGTFMSGILIYTHLDGRGTSEPSKIQRVANTCGLTVLENGKRRTMQLLRRTCYEWGREYIYRIPLGLSFEDFQKKKQHIEDGLNNKRGFLDISLEDIKTLRLRSDLFQQIKEMFNSTKGRKEILLNYDGTLKIRVYKAVLTEIIPFDDDTLAHCTGWKVCVGISREETMYHDFETIPHLIVAGTTRYGKSVFLKNVITTLVHTQPNAVLFTLLDLKGGLAFNRYKNVKQVETVAKDVDESLEALRALHTQMKQRQVEFLAKGYEDVKEAHRKQRNFIVIDEAAELASQGEHDTAIKKKKIECEHIIAEIARIGGGLGFRLIFATQYPTADTLPRQVKQNCDAKLCFRLQTDTASHVVLDESGAEDLPLIKGRAIYRTDRKFIVQTPLIENDFIDKTIKPHIVIKPRKEPFAYAGITNKEDAPGRSYSLIIEEA